MATIGLTPIWGVATERLADERGPFTYLFYWFVAALRDADSARAKQRVFGLGLLLLLPALLTALCVSFKVDGALGWQWRTVFALVWLVDAACLVYCNRAIRSATMATLSRTLAHLVVYSGLTTHHIFLVLQLEGHITWGWSWVFFPFIATVVPVHGTLLTIVVWAQLLQLAPRLAAAVHWSWLIVFTPLELYAIGSLVYYVRGELLFLPLDTLSTILFLE
ncbi:hypothetical protein SDRG_04701 [Saprolegnia diclina VS20]|uniref:Uncharacterized protein n=1 Tax=Saprolegnia diclina (strain VS20) TaxID=1156394 RepID=T0S6A8_SAPDV|nr:hypothetical protein SDRG_04701 [Saprolegnia diclina VS20]EQC38277.1 hypothetical protein SDRG_04701 [Saprolegnia diclina VS20]|eukprot:XP_008608604.1 hypothetical protein SDRG_04701 [Saprolegnia diclina VS20]